jgi:hypothetical protein
MDMLKTDHTQYVENTYSPRDEWKPDRLTMTGTQVSEHIEQPAVHPVTSYQHRDVASWIIIDTNYYLGFLLTITITISHGSDVISSRFAAPPSGDQ